jgi:hypothetical protein
MHWRFCVADPDEIAPVFRVYRRIKRFSGVLGHVRQICQHVGTLKTAQFLEFFHA